MRTLYRTTITEIGPDVGDLVAGGVLILFAEGAPPELAEVSVLHLVEEGPSADAPPVGATIRIGLVEATLTAVGELAWKKVAELGHVVINFNGAAKAERPGELCASVVAGETLVSALLPGAEIVVAV